MSRLEFISSLVRSLAWPTAALVVLLFYRTAIRDALSGQVKRWKAGPSGVEVEYWEQTIEAAREQLPPEVETQIEVGNLADELADLAAVTPAAAVLESYARIERELRRIVEGLTPPDELDRMSGRRLAELAEKHGRISSASLNAVNGLSVMRNLAAHGHSRDDLDSIRALEFVHLADAVLFALRNEPST